MGAQLARLSPALRSRHPPGPGCCPDWKPIMAAKPLVIGSRGSPLALRQADLVKSRLRQAYPLLPIVVQVIRTTGDRRTEAPLHQLGGKGVFTKEIGKRPCLVARSIWLSIVFKDLPTVLPDGLCLGAITPPGRRARCLSVQSVCLLGGAPPTVHRGDHQSPAAMPVVAPAFPI